MKYRYAIIDRENNPYTIVRRFDDLEEAKKYCHKLRRDRYANHDRIQEIIYEQMGHDNGYNVVKISENIF